MSTPITPSSGGCRPGAYSSKVISAIWYPPAAGEQSVLQASCSAKEGLSPKKDSKEGLSQKKDSDGVSDKAAPGHDKDTAYGDRNEPEREPEPVHEREPEREREPKREPEREREPELVNERVREPEQKPSPRGDLLARTSPDGATTGHRQEPQRQSQITLFRLLKRRQQGSRAGAPQRAGGLREHRSDVKDRDKYNKNTSSSRPNGPDGQAGTREAQAKSEVLLSANAHTQLNPRHGRDQNSEAACAASSNIAQLNKKSNSHSALSFSREVSPSAKREYRSYTPMPHMCVPPTRWLVQLFF